MYPETEKHLKNLEELLKPYFSNGIPIELVNTLDHFIFEVWEEGYIKSLKDFEEKDDSS